jgi:hypothetical protein
MARVIVGFHDAGLVASPFLIAPLLADDLSSAFG